MCQMLRTPVLYYMMRVVPKDATPPWLDSGKVTDDETRPLPLFSTMIFRKLPQTGAAFTMLWGGESLWKNRK